MNRVYYLDVIRAVAIFLVVILHSTSTFLYKYKEIAIFDWSIANIYDSVVRMSVPLFFMISGVIFLKMKNKPLDIFFKKRFLKIIIHLLGWSIIYIIFRKYVLSEDINIIKDFILSLIRKEYYHLWFLYALVGIYLILPILKVFIANSSETLILYFLILWFIVSSLYPIVTTLLHIEIPNYLAMMSGYSGYVVLGYFLSNIKITKKIINASIVVYIISTLVTIFGTFYLTQSNNAFNNFFYSNFSISTVFQSISIFLFLKYIANNLKYSKIVTLLSLTSFGIYLVHPIVMSFLENSILHNIGIIIYVPILTFLT